MSAVSLDELYTPTAVAERLPDWSAVDETALTTFAAQGYLVIERAFDAATVTAAQAAIDSLIMRPDTRRCLQFEPTAPGDLAEADLATKRTWIRKLMWFVEHDARLGDMARDPALTATLTRLMGEPPVLFQDMALLKPAGVGSEKPWHQDCAYFNIDPAARVVGVWIALDQATPANGCMHIVPGSHRAGPLGHFKRRDWQICDTDIDLGGIVAVPLPPGGALLFSGLLHHGTPPNRSDRPRRALQYHYKNAACEDIPLEQRLAVFGAEGRGAEC